MTKTFPDSKQIWATHCESQYVPLYFRPWWMDCVCGTDNWDVCLSLDGGGKVEGALLYFISRYWGLKVIKMPPLTAYSGLWLDPHYKENKTSSRMAFEKRVCKKLLDQLPDFSFFYQEWHPDVKNWLPYYWRGFKQTTHYTYRIDLSLPIELLLQNTNKTVRKRIRRTAHTLNVLECSDLSLIYSLYKSSLENQGSKPSFSLNQLEKLDKRLSTHHQRKIIAAICPKGEVHAAQYLVWDEKTTYALFGGIKTEIRNTSGALYLLFWESIIRNYGQSDIFDFEGSIIEPVEESLRSLGGVLTPHFKITRTPSKWLKILGLALNKDL